MSNRSAIYKNILKDYDQLQLVALSERNLKREELYRTLPRLEEIDRTLSMTGLEMTRAVLNNSDDLDGKIEELKKRQLELKTEKEQLLAQNGLRADCLELKFKCNICKDTGYVENERCSCFQQKLIDAVYNNSNLEQILKEENFNQFKLDYYSTDVPQGQLYSPREIIQRNLAQCLSFTKNFRKSGGNLFLCGQTGLGKTFMCNCIAKELLDMGVTVMYTTAPQLFRELERERFGKTDEDDEKDEYLEDILNVELLIIDDLGTEFETSFTSSQLYSIINTRLIHQRPIIISTNLDMKDLSEKYSDRITSRLMGDFTTLYFFGEDIRTLKKFK